MRFTYKHISAFDLDKTLLSCNSSFLFSRFLYRHKVFSLMNWLYSMYVCMSYQLFGSSMKNLHHRVFKRLFKGNNLSSFEHLAHEFAHSYTFSMINPIAMSRLLLAKEHNHYILLLSSAPDFLVKPIAKVLGIPNSKGTVYNIDEKGSLQHISLLMDGEEKANQLQQIMTTLNIHKEHSTAYSDSLDDLPFLQAAGVAVGVNPTKKLRSVCNKNNWEILEYEPHP